MIIKLKSFKKPQFKRLLEYMMNDENRLYDKNDKSFLITHNLKGRKIEKLVAQFVDNENYRKRKRKDSVILTHEIISFHKDDSENISIGKLEEIAREYINQRNPNGLYVAVPHFDKEHYHIHICASGVEYHLGKSLRMSKEDFQKFKKDIQNFQVERFPEISKSVVAHNKKANHRISEKEYQQKLRTGRVTKKEQVIETIEACLKTSHSKNEFYRSLKNSGLETYERNGKVTGVVLDKMKFRFARLGLPQERLEALSMTDSRGNELNDVRKRRGNIITRYR